MTKKDADEREQLWIDHGCNVRVVYGRRLWCPHCLVDFRTAPLTFLRELKRFKE